MTKAGKTTLRDQFDVARPQGRAAQQDSSRPAYIVLPTRTRQTSESVVLFDGYETLPERDHVAVSDIEQGGDLSIREVLVVHALQHRQFELWAVELSPLGLDTCGPMNAIRRSP